MIEMLFWIAVGIVIGWNLPQPAWAHELQEKAMRTIREMTNKPR